MKQLGPIILVIIIIWLIVDYSKNRNKSPREMNGVMIYETDDSVYYLRFIIDTAEEIEVDQVDDRFR